MEKSNTHSENLSLWLRYPLFSYRRMGDGMEQGLRQRSGRKREGSTRGVRFRMYGANAVVQ